MRKYVCKDFTYILELPAIIFISFWNAEINNKNILEKAVAEHKFAALA